MATTIRYWVDPGVVDGDGSGSSAANAYASLNAAEVARAGNITAAGANTNIEFWCINPTDVDDATACDFYTGWTVDSTHSVRVLVDPDYQCDGNLETGYRLRAAVNGGSVLVCGQTSISFVGLCIENTYAYIGTNIEHCAVRQYIALDVTFARCRLHCNTGGTVGAAIYGSTGKAAFMHSILSGYTGINLGTFKDIDIYLSTVTGTGARALQRPTVQVPPDCYSVAIVDCADDWNTIAGFTGNYNSSHIAPDTGYPGTTGNVQNDGTVSDFEADGFTPTAGSVVLGAGYPAWTSSLGTTGRWAMSDGWSAGPNDFHNNVRPYLDDMSIGAIDVNSLSASSSVGRGLINSIMLNRARLV
jgi:hypothetical protein